MNQDGAQLSDTDLREEVNTFMFAGDDTIATSVSWFLYALGRKQEYQSMRVVGDQELTLDLLSKLVWLDACMNKSLRVYPVTPLIARQINSPFKLSDSRYFPEPKCYLNAILLKECEKSDFSPTIPFIHILVNK